MWRQRSRVHWLKEGDQNTRFFHSKATHRRKRNMIKRLKDKMGVWLEGSQRDGLIVDFFKNLFASSMQGCQDAVLSCVDQNVTEEMNLELTKPYVAEEVNVALDQMHPTKAPGLMVC